MGDAETFDCLLSHNSKDKPAVRGLAEALRAAGVSVWLDEEQLRPGLSSQAELEAGIRASRSVAVLVGAHGLGPWEDEERQAAVALAVRDKRPVIPVLLPGAAETPGLALFLATRTWVDLRPGADSDPAAGLARLVWGITGRKPKKRVASAPRPRRRPVAVKARSVRPAASLERDAVAAVIEYLDLVPALGAARARQPALAGAAGSAGIAARLCAAQGDFLVALRALKAALPEAARQLRQSQGDLPPLRRHALAILGWVAVTTVLDGYDWEDAPLIRAWQGGGALHIPLGRSPCVEVLTACWRRGRAEFSMEPERFDFGQDEITPARFGEIGFDDPKRLDLGRALDYIWRRVYQQVHGQQAPRCRRRPRSRPCAPGWTSRSRTTTDACAWWWTATTWTAPSTSPPPSRPSTTRSCRSTSSSSTAAPPPTPAYSSSRPAGWPRVSTTACTASLVGLQLAVGGDPGQGLQPVQGQSPGEARGLDPGTRSRAPHRRNRQGRDGPAQQPVGDPG